MMKKILIGVLFSALAIGMFPESYAAAQSKDSFTPKQKKEIGEVVKQYMLDNPQLLMEVSQKLRQKESERAQQAAMKAIGENFKELLSSQSPVLGNPQGNVVLVQFIDYQCAHCKAMHAIIAKLITENPNLKVITKGLGILGPESENAVKATLVANKQGKFQSFYQLLDKAKLPLTQKEILESAKLAGLDLVKFEQEINSEEMNKELLNNAQLAQKIGIGGAPAFIILSDIKDKQAKVFFSTGTVTQATLQKYISQPKS